MSCSKCSNYSDITAREKVAKYTRLPYLRVDSPASNIRHLTDVDADANMPLDDNFAYYTTHDFHNNYDISQCFPNKQFFSILNFNVRSPSKNYDNFTNMLSNLYHPFSLIGFSETKITSDQQPITNIDLPGYHFVSQPTLSDWGGVGFYIKNSSRYKDPSRVVSSY